MKLPSKTNFPTRKLIFLLVFVLVISATVSAYDYAKGLQLSIYFFDANKCGPDAGPSRLEWRGPCHWEDAAMPIGKSTLSPTLFSQYQHIFDPDGDGLMDLSGGFHDAGDHIRFGIPTTYAGSTLAWGLYNFKDVYVETGQYEHLKEILYWFSDYYKKTTFVDENGKVIAFAYMVGGGVDHTYWGPPELQKENEFPRDATFGSWENPASDVAAGIAATLALHYLNFKDEDSVYSQECLDLAVACYDLAKGARGLSSGGGFYSSSYDDDELSWAGVWLYRATGDMNYINDIISIDSNGIYTGWVKKIVSTTANTWQNIWVHCWDTVWAGVFVELSKILPENPQWDYFARWNLEYWSGGVIPHEDPADLAYLQYSPGGYVCLNAWGSARYNTAAQLSALIYAKNTNRLDFAAWAKSQMDYLMGDNPMERNYIVGYAENSARHYHHRAAHGSTNNSMLDPPEHKHTLWGALVGGPDADDLHVDTTTDYSYNEVAIDYNTAFVGALAGLYYFYNDGTMAAVPNFPPVETPVDQIFPMARLEQENGERTQITITLNNDSSQPPHLDDGLTARYFFDISEMIAAGQSVEDLIIEKIYDENAASFGGPTLVTGPHVFDPYNNIYYVEFDWRGFQVFGPRELHFGIIAKLDAMYKAHWDPSNDWSRQGITETDAKAAKICVYSDGVLIWGEEPVLGPTPTPTIPGSTPGPTPVPQPGFKVQYQCYETEPVAGGPTFLANLINTGGVDVALSDMKIRYYYTIEGGGTQVFNCDYAVLGAHLVNGTFGNDGKGNNYVEVGFSASAGTLKKGSMTGELKIRFNKQDWSTYTQTNDYSFDPSIISYTDYNKITVYYKGTKMWGVEPGEPVATPTPTIPVSCLLIGDVNASGTVDIVDALMTAQYYVGLNPPGYKQSCGDVNCDGSVNIVDALMIAQRYVGLLPSLGC